MARDRKPVLPRLDRWATLNAFVDDQLAELTRTVGPSAGLVWLALFRRASGTDGRVTSASERRLSESTGLTRPTIATALRALTAKGFIRVERDATRRAAPVYVVEHLEHEASEQARGQMVLPQRPNGFTSRGQMVLPQR